MFFIFLMMGFAKLSLHQSTFLSPHPAALSPPQSHLLFQPLKQLTGLLLAGTLTVTQLLSLTTVLYFLVFNARDRETTK